MFVGVSENIVKSSVPLCSTLNHSLTSQIYPSAIHLLLFTSTATTLVLTCHLLLVIYCVLLTGLGSLPGYFFFFFFFFFMAALGAYGSSWTSTGVELELQLQSYVTTAATPDPSCICDLHHSSWQYQILNLLS